MIEKKESIVFIEKVTPNVPYEGEFYLNKNTRVKKITVTFAEGQDGSLKVKPYALNGYGTPVDLYNAVSDKMLSGNNNEVTLNCDVFLNNNAYLKVIAENQGDYDYTVNVVFDIEYVEEVKNV